MPSFKGNKKIIIQPNTKDVSYRFHVTTCSSATANDGMLPFSTTISSVVTSAKTADGTTDTELIESTLLSSPDIDLTLSYPVTNGAGRYKITFVLMMSNASEIEIDFHRVEVVDL